MSTCLGPPGGAFAGEWHASASVMANIAERLERGRGKDGLKDAKSCYLIIGVCGRRWRRGVGWGFGGRRRGWASWR